MLCSPSLSESSSTNQKTCEADTRGFWSLELVDRAVKDEHDKRARPIGLRGARLQMTRVILACLKGGRGPKLPRTCARHLDICKNLSLPQRKDFVRRIGQAALVPSALCLPAGAEEPTISTSQGQGSFRDEQPLFLTQIQLSPDVVSSKASCS